jgi:hypothetical protein
VLTTRERDPAVVLAKFWPEFDPDEFVPRWDPRTRVHARLDSESKTTASRMKALAEAAANNDLASVGWLLAAHDVNQLVCADLP